MPPSEILIHDLATGDPVRLADAASVTVSSANAGWSGLAVEHQYLPPGEAPDGYIPWHLLSVQLSPPPVLEDYRDGRTHFVRLAPGDVVFRPGGVPARAAWNGTSEAINITLDPAVVADEAASGARPPAQSHFGPDPVVRHLALALRADLASGSPGGRLFADGVRTALTAHVLTRYAGSRLAGGPRRLTPAELARVRERIHADLTEDLRLADLAAAVPLSPYHFSRLFKATTGLTPHRYVMRCRAEAARALLARSHLGLDEIARRTGFADRAHLTRQFRRHFSTTPRAFRAAGL